MIFLLRAQLVPVSLGADHGLGSVPPSICETRMNANGRPDREETVMACFPFTKKSQ